MLQISQIILLIGIAQGAILSFTLFTSHRGPQPANKILGLSILLFSIIVGLYLFRSIYIARFSLVCITIQLMFFLIGPFIYFYVRALTERPITLRTRLPVHLTPIILAGIGYSLILLFKTDSHLDILQRIEFLGDYSPVLNKLLSVQLLSYLVITLVLLKRHSKLIKDQFSSIEKINLNWLRLLAGGLTLICGLSLVVFLFRKEFGQILWGYFSFALALFMYLMGYLGLKQSVIFAAEPWENQDELQQETGKYRKSTLTEEKADEYLVRLNQLMIESKPHFESDITLKKLASMLLISHHFLSQIINEKLGKNFYEFINEHRIREAQLKLQDETYQYLTIAAIGFEVGFNSTSTFHTAFKKYTGQTPSQFRKNGMLP